MAQENKKSPLKIKSLYKNALKSSLKKLHPKDVVKNPIMLVVYTSCILCTLATLKEFFDPKSSPIQNTNVFNLMVTLWMWFTLFFANFAESIAEGRGKAQASSLKRVKKETLAKLQLPNGETRDIPSSQLKKGDVVVVGPGLVIPGDGSVVSGAALVDESAITGESAPVVREAGGDRSAVTGGTTVLTNELIIQVTQDPGKSFLDQMILLVEGASRKKTPNEIALNNLLLGLTMIFLPVVGTLNIFAQFNGVVLSPVVLVALLVCLIPTTIGGLLSAIGIAGMDRLVKRNILALSGRAVEAAGNVDVLILDKTGTITIGNRMASEFFPAPGLNQKDIAEAAVLCSLADLTPEGRSIVALGEKFGIPPQSLPAEAVNIPFTAETRMSGLDLKDRRLRKGACDAVKQWLHDLGGLFPEAITEEVNRIGALGGTPLVVATDSQVLGVVYLKDVVKVGIADRFQRIRKMGIKTIMVTGDNKLTAKAIAQEAGVDDYVAEARPEDKLQMIRALQKDGHLVAMGGDGTNDAPALAQADVGLVMNTGTQAAREAGNMLDLDSDPTKVIDVVEVGKQLLITRGALTTFSIANDVAKYFAILPALFVSQFPGLQFLNVMSLKSGNSAILSAVIFNALIIVALIPLALKGVHYRPTTAKHLLKKNILFFGVGGLVTPFVVIKIIDDIINSFLKL